jgi:hypothetical protein
MPVTVAIYEDDAGIRTFLTDLLEVAISCGADGSLAELAANLVNGD